MARKAGKTGSITRDSFPEGEAGVSAFRKAKLKEIGSKRIAKTVNAIRNIGRLGRYKPAERQTTAAFGVLLDELNAARKMWLGAEVAKAVEFTLPD